MAAEECMAKSLSRKGCNKLRRLGSERADDRNRHVGQETCDPGLATLAKELQV